MIDWQLKLHLAQERVHSRLYRGVYKGRGVQLEIHTPVRDGVLGKPKVAFFADYDEREFATEEELVAALEQSGVNSEKGGN